MQTFRLTYRLNAADGSEDRFTVENPNYQIQPAPQNPPISPNRPPQNPQNPPININRPPQNPQQTSGENINQFQDDNTVCGVPVVLSQSLVVGGQPAGNFYPF